MKKKIFIIILSLISILLISSVLTIFYQLSPVNRKDKNNIEFIVESGWGKNQIIEELNKKDLIRSSLITKIYLKLNNKELYAGTYNLNKSMSTNEIFLSISNQNNIKTNDISITFVEGKRLSTYVNQISKAFNYTEDEIYEKINDKKYLNELIDRYWFLTDDILNEQIYYPLEGYLYPDTYDLKQDSSIDDILTKFLNNTDKKLSDYKDELKDNKYTIHEYISLASLVELEGSNPTDRAMLAGVFYNRLKSSTTLGSDVTTYYAVKKDFTEDLTVSELNSCNGYNTRGTCVKGIPVGPICNSSISSIKAVVEPTENKYYFFVADNTKKLYFSETISEHEQTVATLKSEGKWYTY